MSNACRRVVSAQDKRDTLAKLGKMLLDKGVTPEQLAQKISEETGMSYRWVMEYLPNDLKYPPGLGGPKKIADLDKYTEKNGRREVARSATAVLNQLKLDSRKRFIFIRNHTNTSFVTLIMEKRFYERLEKIAKNLGTDPETDQ